jgi:hypothetical protein
MALPRFNSISLNMSSAWGVTRVPRGAPFKSIRILALPSTVCLSRFRRASASLDRRMLSA